MAERPTLHPLCNTTIRDNVPQLRGQLPAEESVVTRDEELTEFWRQKIQGASPSIKIIREIGECDVNAAFQFYACSMVSDVMSRLIAALDRHGTGRFKIVEGQPEAWEPQVEYTIERVP